LSYASLYLCRKGVAVSKARLVSDLAISERTLAVIDTAYLLTYALGQFASGAGVGRFGGRRVIALGLVGSALACFAFGASSTGWVLVVCFALNGLFQATGWPAGTSIMAGWYPARERGAAMGLWSTNYQAGGLLGTALATLLLARFGWRVAIAGPGLWLLVVAVLVVVWLRDRPPRPEAELAQDPRAAAAPGSAPPAGLGTALRDPALWVIATAHVCLKIVLYGLIFWIPYWLHTALDYDDAAAGTLSVALEAGGIAGTIVTGRLSDLAVHRGRGFVAACMMFLLALVLAAQPFVPSAGTVVHAAWIAAVGFFLFGPESLVAGAAAQDLGARHGTAVAVGAVNGIGSLGAIAQGAFTLGLRDAWGWSGVFAGFVALAVAGALALLLLPLVSRRLAR
jgi:sugar phosphate permease